MTRQELNPVTCRLDNREVKIQLCGSRLGRVPCQSKLQRKNAGTSSWPSWISHFTGSFVGHSPSEMLCPPALFKKGEEGRKKKEVLHLSRCYTHTHTYIYIYTCVCALPAYEGNNSGCKPKLTCKMVGANEPSSQFMQSLPTMKLTV